MRLLLIYDFGKGNCNSLLTKLMVNRLLQGNAIPSLFAFQINQRSFWRDLLPFGLGAGTHRLYGACALCVPF